MSHLVWAARDNDIETVERILIEGKVCLNHESCGGTTALIAAAEKGHLEICQMLLDYGANLDHKDSYAEETALVYAARSGEAEVVSFLLERGADCNVVTESGETCLTWAVYNNKIEVAKILVSAGADVDHQNRHGNTPLMLAAAMGESKMVEILTDAGADLDLCNTKNHTAMSLAASLHHHRVEALLQKLDKERNEALMQKEMKEADDADGFDLGCVYKDDRGIVPHVTSPLSSTAAAAAAADAPRNKTAKRGKTKRVTGGDASQGVRNSQALYIDDSREPLGVEQRRENEYSDEDRTHNSRATTATTSRPFRLPSLRTFIITLMMLPVTLLISEYLFGYPKLSDLLRPVDEEWIIMDI